MGKSGTVVAGFSGLRGAVLVELKKAQPLTARELAGRFRVTPNGLRRHLKALEAAGVVRYRREVRGVGGPVFAYSLTERGEELFPRSYDSALAAALEVVKQDQGEDGVIRLFQQQWSHALQEARGKLESLPLAERARYLAELVSSMGYMAEVEVTSQGETTIREHNCAIRTIARQFPEVCAAEARFFEEILGAAVQRQSHMLQGCNSCDYLVRIDAKGEAGAAATDAVETAGK